MVRNIVQFQSLVVSTEVTIARVPLGHHVERSRPVARRGLNDYQLQHVFEFLLDNVLTLWRNTMGLHREWREF